MCFVDPGFEFGGGDGLWCVGRVVGGGCSAGWEEERQRAGGRGVIGRDCGGEGDVVEF